MKTVIYDNDTKQICGYASFITTRENLGIYPEEQYELVIVDDDMEVSLSHKITLSGGKVSGSEPVPIPITPSRDILKELDSLTQRVEALER